MTTIQIVFLCGLAGALVVAAISDLRARIIPNWLNAAIAIAAIGWWWASGLTATEMLLQIGAALAVLILFGGCFALGMMGGGDVKLITALALWLATPKLLIMLIWMAIGGGVLTLLMVALHAYRRAEGRPEVPYGVAIAGAALFSVANDILTTPVA